MKKLLLSLALVAMVAMNASSGQIFWAANEVRFAGNNILTSDDLTCQLIKISNDDTISVSMTENFSVQDISSSVYSPQAVGNAPFQNRYFYGDEVTNLNPPLEEGSYYIALLTYEINGETYFNLAKSSQQCYDYMTEVNIMGGVEFMGDFDFNNEMAEGTILTNGGGWVKAPAVPEPATGALALAGVALLFRRRRA